MFGFHGSSDFVNDHRGKSVESFTFKVGLENINNIYPIYTYRVEEDQTQGNTKQSIHHGK